MPLQDRPFEPIRDNVDDREAEQGPAGDARWMVCRREGLKFMGFGGPRDLGRLIGVFRAWAAS
jgi:hypothetical protein